MFEASGRGAAGGPRADGLAGFGVDHEAGRWRRRRRARSQRPHLRRRAALARRCRGGRRAAAQEAAASEQRVSSCDQHECRKVAALDRISWDNPCLWAKSWTSSPSRDGARTGRKRPSKTALVLGGGGFTGGVYEIGALRALDLLAVNSTVNNFDVYVGTSAGSFVAGMLANGVTPDEMMQVLNKRGPVRARGPRPRQGAEAQLPRLPAEGRGAAAAQRSSWLRSAGPDRRGLGDRHRRRPGRGAADRPLLRLAASPTTSRRCSPTPAAPTTSACSTASSTSPRPTSTPASGSSSARRAGPTCRSRRRSQCSTALPIVYKPVELKGRQLVDGGIRSTTNVDIAVEQGAKFIVVVNPLVPYVNDFEKTIPTVFGTRVRRVSDMGLPAIANQTFRLIAHARLHQAVEQWQEKYPGVDIILVEPEPERRADVRHADHGLLAAPARSPATASNR